MIVAKAVAELEAEGMSVGLELGAGLQKLVPGIGEFVVTGLLEPVGAPVHQLADIAERDRLPLAVDDDGFLCRVVPAAVFLADLLGDIADIEVFLVVEERPVEEVQRHVRTGSGLCHGGDAGLQAADADQLVFDLDARELLVGRDQRFLEILVIGLDERVLVHQCHGRRRAETRARAERSARDTDCRCLQELPARVVRQSVSRLVHCNPPCGADCPSTSADKPFSIRFIARLRLEAVF